jgi:hypothetical protein
MLKPLATNNLLRVINFKPAKAATRMVDRRARVTLNPTCGMSWAK